MVLEAVLLIVDPQRLVLLLDIFGIFCQLTVHSGGKQDEHGWKISGMTVSSYPVIWKGITHPLYSTTYSMRWARMVPEPVLPIRQKLNRQRRESLT